MTVMETASHPTLIIGLGTGRCGTQSLSRFLSNQPGMIVLHEGTIDGHDHPFRWQDDHDRVRSWVEGLPGLLGHPAYCGDVGMYFLPYCEFLIALDPGIRFVCLERDRAEVIESFVRHTPGRHPWMHHDGSHWRIDPVWDAVYPKFDEPDKCRAVGLYWDLYHAEVSRLVECHPDKVRRFPTDSLNSREGRTAILDFVGYRGPRNLDAAFRFNASRGAVRFRLRSGFEWLLDAGRRLLPTSVRRFLWDHLGQHVHRMLR